MNSTELVQRIDDSVEMGRKIMADQTVDDIGGKEASDGVKRFCNGIKVLIEEVYGMGNQLSGKFEALARFDSDMVEEGMAVLTDLRKLVEYSGDFGS
jgi:hypothetical protein